MRNIAQRFFLSARIAPLALLAATAVAPPAQGADAYTQARRYLAQESFDEALPLLRQAYGHGRNPAALPDLAMTLYRLDRLDEAAPLLRRAVAAKPGDPHLRAALIRTLLAMGRARDALPVLARLQGLGPAQTALLKGQVHAALGERETAVAAYRAGLDSADTRTRQRLALHLVPLYLEMGRATQARDLAQTAIGAAPDSFDADSLRLLLKRTARPAYDVGVHLHYRFESDDNVRQQPDRLPLPGNKSDTRHVLMADLLGRYGLNGAYDLFGEVHLYRSFHNQLTDFDQTIQDYVGALGWSGTGWGWRLPLEYSHTDLGDKNYRSSLSLSPGAYRQFNDGSLLQGFVRWQSDDYANDATLRPADRQDDQRVGAGLLWRRPLADGKGDLRLLLERYRDDADGTNWDRDLTRFFARGEYRLLPRLKVGLSYQFERYAYAHTNDLFLARREDNVHSVSGWLAWAITPHWEARLQGSYVDWGSTLDAYAYTRSVVSAGVSWNY